MNGWDWEARPGLPSPRAWAGGMLLIAALVLAIAFAFIELVAR